MAMKIIELDEKMLVGIRVVCPGDQYVSEIPQAAIELKNRISEINHVVLPARLIGAFVAGDFSQEEDGYWACVEVSDIDKIPEGMVSLNVPKQRYAVRHYKGPNHGIRFEYDKLHRWIEENGYERIQRSWHLEISDEWGSEEAGNEVNVELYDTIK